MWADPLLAAAFVMCCWMIVGVAAAPFEDCMLCGPHLYTAVRADRGAAPPCDCCVRADCGAAPPCNCCEGWLWCGPSLWLLCEGWLWCGPSLWLLCELTVVWLLLVCCWVRCGLSWLLLFGVTGTAPAQMTAGIWLWVPPSISAVGCLLLCSDCDLSLWLLAFPWKGFCPHKFCVRFWVSYLLFVWGFDCGKCLWPYSLGGKKVPSSLGKRSNLYGGSMSWTLPEHNYNWFCIPCGGCDLFRGKSSGQGKFIYSSLSFSDLNCILSFCSKISRLMYQQWMLSDLDCMLSFLFLLLISEVWFVAHDQIEVPFSLDLCTHVWFSLFK
jgi:hypothetical protein